MELHTGRSLTYRVAAAPAAPRRLLILCHGVGGNEGNLAVAGHVGGDLIVLGEARDRRFGPAVEGTIEEVVRKSPVSVLLVRDRPRSPCRHPVVGRDFTDEALQALVMAARLFTDASITFMHAFMRTLCLDARRATGPSRLGRVAHGKIVRANRCDATA